MDSPRLIASMAVGGKRCPWLETVFSEVSVASVQLVGNPEAIHMSGKSHLGLWPGGWSRIRRSKQWVRPGRQGARNLVTPDAGRSRVGGSTLRG